MSTHVLTKDDIAKLMANTREKGRDERFLRSFVASQEAWTVITDDPAYSQRENLQSVKNALRANIKKLGDTVNNFKVNLALVQTDDDQLILVNRELFATEDIDTEA